MAVKVMVTTDKNVAGLSFTVNFDKAKLQIASTAVGSDAASMTPVGVEVSSANGDGSLEVSMVDFTFSNPIRAGTNQEIYTITFKISSGTTGVIPIELVDISLSDPSASYLEISSIINGTITVGGSSTAPPGTPVLNDPGSSVTSDTGYRVSWGSISGATSYTIEEATNSLFSGANSQTVSSTSQSFNHSVNSATTYYYRVKANNESGSSNWSNVVDMEVTTTGVNASDWNGTWVASQGSQYGSYDIKVGDSWTISNASYDGSVVRANVTWFSTYKGGNLTGTLEYNPTGKTLLIDCTDNYYDDAYTDVTISSSALRFREESTNYSFSKST